MPADASTAQPIEVIDAAEAQKRQASGGYLADGSPAPEAAMVDTATGPAPQTGGKPPVAAADDDYFDQYSAPGAPKQPTGRVAAADDDYFDRSYGKPIEPTKPVIKPPAPETHPMHAFFKGAVGQSNRLLQLMALAGYSLRPTEASMRASAAEGGQDMPTQDSDFDQQAGDAYFKNVVDPIVENQQRFDLAPDASFSEKLAHGVGSTLMMIDQAIATGGEGAAATTATTFAGRATVGAATMTVPAAAAAVDTGRRVLEATGDKKAAAVAGATSYLTSVASGAVPFGVGKSLLARIPTAAATGAAVGEINRDVTNAAMPDSMQQPFSLEQASIDALIGAPFGLMGGHNGEQIPRGPDVPAATEKPQNIMEHAQSVAAAEAKANGGDLLDQTVAASHVNAVLGAHHDAAAYEGHLEVQQQQAEQLRLETEQEEAQRNQAAAFEAAEEAKKSNATPLSDAFAEVEQNTEEGRAQDYSKAFNQKGDQDIAAAQDAEKGGTGFEQPKLLDGLDPDQLKAFKTLAERRTAEMDSQEHPDAVKERLRAQNPEDNFTPYVEPKKAAPAPEVALAPEVAPKEPVKAPESLAARRNGNGMQAPELPTAEREAPAAAVQAPDLRVSGTESPTETEEADPALRPAELEPEAAARQVVLDAPESVNGDSPIVAAARSIAERRNGNGASLEPEDAPIPRDNGTGQFRKKTFADRRAERQFVAEQKGRPLFSDRENNARTGPADVEHVVEGRSHVATTENGETRARRDGNGDLRVISTHTEPGARGSGEGTARIERLAQEAHKIGGKLVSDSEVSEPEQRVYKALADRGYDVKENTNTADPGTGVKKSTSELKGVYEVGPNKEPVAARDTAPPNSTRQADAARAQPLTHEEAARTLKPVLDKMGENVQLHADHTTLPPHIQQAMTDHNHPAPRGVYDPRSDQVHIVAGAHESHDELMRTAVHEIVGHQGIRHLLGDDYAAKMADIYQRVKGNTWLKDYAAQHGLDVRNARHQRLLADEYIAHLAEDGGTENPSIFRQAIDAVRAGLRKVGLVRDWTDDDIRQLIRKSANNLAAENSGIAESARGKGDGPRFADKEDEVPYPADHPLAQVHKFGKTMEEQANYNPDYLKSRLDWAKDKLGETTDARLAFIGLRNLPDFMDGKVMPSLRQFIRVHDQMDGRRGDLMNKAADLARDWSRYVSKDKARGGALGELMHASTLGGVDPSKPWEARYTDAEKKADATKQAHEDMRKDLHSRLKDMFNKQLDDKGRELFNTVRDRYAQHRQEVFKALESRIMESGADNNTKQMIMGELRKKFESGKVQGPYFPLARFGDHWASAKDKDGNTVSFSRFESASQKKAWINEMKEKGFATDGGQHMDDKSMMERIDPKFVQQITEMAKKVDPKLADEVWQAYLRAMPEMSMRKHFIHRVGRLGYSMDALRAFASNSFHGAHQLARLEYGNRLDSTLDNIKTEARAAESADPTSKNAQWAPALAREMARRYEWIKNPRSSPLASALTKFGFGWYLGAAPATAFRIFSQNPMIAQPMLAKFHGQIGSTKELSRASAQWAMSRGELGDTLRGDERRAFDTANERGMFSSTATQSLASGGSGEPMFTGTYYHVQKAMGYLFNAMEHHNRQTTFLAAYRLGRTQGMSHDAAVDHAGDLTWDSHFDYTNANRPRVLQNDFAKVALLFKQYSWGVTYRLAREARDMFNSELTPEENVMARKAFTGLLTRGMMFAGVTGLPLSWIATSVINAVMGDQDRPFDAEAAAHASLEQHLGKTAADAVMTGPVGAITGASLSGGASYNDLWYRPPARDEKPEQQWSDLTGQLLGAIPAIGTNIATGASMMHDGQIERGLEHFVPPEMSALMKAYRYNKEGVTNLRGEPILTRDELDNRDLFLQSIGFTPQKVADARRVNTALKNVSQAIQDRREQLLNRLTVVSGMNDSAEIDDTMKQIEHFDSVNPGVAIGGKAIISSMRNRFKNAAESINGVKLPPGLNDLRDTYAPTETPP